MRHAGHACMLNGERYCRASRTLRKCWTKPWMRCRRVRCVSACVKCHWQCKDLAAPGRLTVWLAISVQGDLIKVRQSYAEVSSLASGLYIGLDGLNFGEVLATQRRLQNQKEPFNECCVRPYVCGFTLQEQADKMADDWYRRAEMAALPLAKRVKVLVEADPQECACNLAGHSKASCNRHVV